MNNEDLGGYLSEIASKSERGAISWEKINSSTYRWSQAIAHGVYVVTLQKASTPERVYISNGKRIKDGGDVFLFQVFEKGRSDPIVSLSSKERPEFYEALAKVYEGVEKGMDIVAKNVLGLLLGKGN